MKSMRRTKRYSGLAVGVAVLTLAGCSQFDQLLGREEPIDYRSTVSGDPLSIPPDLTQASQHAQYRAPEGTTTFSQYARSQEERSRMGARDQILPERDDIRVMRDGDLRWLVVNQPAEDLYTKVVDFWGEQGFTIYRQDPRAGVMETDWAENRGKIPEGWIKSALGFILDQVYDSGERERFRTRLERVDGKTEIYITHDQMVETGTADRSGWKWVEGKEDPNLNAAMLARLMVFLGTDTDHARQLVAEAQKTDLKPEISAATDGQAMLNLNQPFDRAWRRVGVGIDSAGFSLEDRDRSTGDYYIRYLDTDTGRKVSQPGLIDRMLGRKSATEADTLVVRVIDRGQSSSVIVTDRDGQQDNSETARRILTVLAEHM